MAEALNVDRVSMEFLAWVSYGLLLHVICGADSAH